MGSESVTVHMHAADMATCGRRLAGFLFVGTAIQKSIWFDSFAASLRSFTGVMPEEGVASFAWMVVAAEVAIGVWLLTAAWPRLASAVGSVMILLLFVASSTQLIIGDTAWCGCVYPGEPLTGGTIVTQTGFLLLLLPSLLRVGQIRRAVALPLLGLALIAGGVGYSLAHGGVRTEQLTEATRIAEVRWIGQPGGQKIVLYSMLSCELCLDTYEALQAYLRESAQPLRMATRYVYTADTAWDYCGAALLLAQRTQLDEDSYLRVARGEWSPLEPVPPNAFTEACKQVEADLETAKSIGVSTVPSIVVEGYSAIIAEPTADAMIKRLDAALKRSAHSIK